MKQDLVERAALAMVNASRDKRGLPTVASFDGFFEEDKAAYIIEAQAAIDAIEPEIRGLVKAMENIRDGERERIDKEKAAGKTLVEASVFIISDEALSNLPEDLRG